MTNSIILQNGYIVDPYAGIEEKRDIAIENGFLVSPDKINRRAEIVDVSGCIITPGLIDMHVHLREPGFEYKENIASGTACAAKGGFTTILAMPNTMPPIDSIDMVDDIKRRITASSCIDTLICGCITKKRLGKEISELLSGETPSEIIAFSDDGDCVSERELMLKAAKIAAKKNLPIVDHCEDKLLQNNGVMRKGSVSSDLNLPGMPGETESTMVERNIAISRETGVRIHIQHISFHKSVELVREARKEGLSITAEASPHHLFLTNEIIPIVGTNAKMNPPLGTEVDRKALWEALLDETITVIATDHAPHAPCEKMKGFKEAPFGIIGLETALPLCFTELYQKAHLSLLKLFEKFTVGPAEVLGLEKVPLHLGNKANIAIFDKEQTYPIDIHTTSSKSLNSPFHRMMVTGKIIGTLHSGNWVYRDC